MKSGRLLSTIADEPYRLWFPLGIVAGIVGVGLWPLWVGGWIELYPGPGHARLMIEGFFAAILFGFLGTAGPRMLEVRPFPVGFWLIAGLIWSGAQIASVLGRTDLAEGGFILSLVGLLTLFARRFPQRNGLPPPGFMLILGSLTLAVFAALTQMPAVQQLGAGHLPTAFWSAGRAFLVEGFVLLPILGAMPFFFGRFGGLPPRHDMTDDRTPDAKWRHQAMVCAATGVLVVAGIVLKGTGSVRIGAGLQALATGAFILTQVPFRYPAPAPTLARLAQLAMICLIVAPLAEAFFPGGRMAWRHLLVIPGFQFVVVTVATWVVCAHAGKRQLCQRKWTVMVILAAGWIVATGLRMVAETGVGAYQAHLVYSAIPWIGASLAWLWVLLPRLVESD